MNLMESDVQLYFLLGVEQEPGVLPVAGADAVDGSGDAQRTDDRVVRPFDGDGDGAETLDRLLVVGRVPAFADPVEFLEQFRRAGDRPVRDRLEAVAVDVRLDLLVRPRSPPSRSGRDGAGS